MTGYVWPRWIPAELRAAGLTVIEVEGCMNRGRPATVGAFDPKEAFTTHHTGALSSAANPATALSLLITGRSDLPGPLCQVATAYDGVVYFIAAGRANVNGVIGKPGLPGMPYGYDGNTLSMGNEVMTDGTQPLPEAQRRSIAVVNVVMLRHFGHGVDRLYRHADISGSGKWDIGQLTTQQIRDDAAQVLAAPAISEENDMQLTDTIGPESDVRVGQLFRRLWNHMEDENRRHAAVLAAIGEVESAVADLPEDTDIATIKRVVRETSQRTRKRVDEAFAQTNAEEQS